VLKKVNFKKLLPRIENLTRKELDVAQDYLVHKRKPIKLIKEYLANGSKMLKVTLDHGMSKMMIMYITDSYNIFNI